MTDAEGNPTAVQIDLKRYGKLWEDIYDNIFVQERQASNAKPFEAVRKDLMKRQKERSAKAR